MAQLVVLDWGSKHLTAVGVTVLCPWAKNFIRCLILVQPRKTRPDMTEKFWLGRKEDKFWLGCKKSKTNENYIQEPKEYPAFQKQPPTLNNRLFQCYKEKVERMYDK